MNHQKYVKRELDKYPFLNENEKQAILRMPWKKLQIFFRLCYKGKYGTFSRIDMIEQIKEEVCKIVANIAVG
jgi:hypothetical protein